MRNEFLNREDYEEPVCPFCTPGHKEPIPLRRIYEKLDTYFDADDTSGAERHLLYWLSEAERVNDPHGKMALYGEQMGLYRKLGRKEEAYTAMERALSEVSALGHGDTVTGAVAYLNAATVKKAFGDAAGAETLYEAARTVFLRELPPNDVRLASLDNNEALALTELKRFEEAGTMFLRALDTLGTDALNAPERAVTYTNLADLAVQRLGSEAAQDEVDRYLAAAYSELDRPDVPHDGNYAFVCDKCAPIFSLYGYFREAAELSHRADTLYGRK